jgi:hypothetical protein
LILVLADNQVSHRAAESIDDVLEWIESEPVERIVIPYPADEAVNPFALARRLKTIHGPPVVLVGEIRLDTQFWAERNGCEVARSVKDAIGQ